MFESIIREIKDRSLNVHGIELTCDGETLFRYMPHEDVRYPIYSCTKTVTALAVGLAVSDGKFDISRPLASYLPHEYLTAMDDDRREAFSRLPVTRFMPMSVPGYPFRAEGEDMLTASLAYDVDYSAVPAFDYSNIPAYLVGLACEYALGRPLAEYIQERLFTPMGIENVTFQTDGQGRYYGATGIYLTLHELNKLGTLILDGGEGIVPREWIAEMSKIHCTAREGGYGYFMYVRPDRLFISGKWGQRSVILPDKHAVLTYMADMPDTSNELHDLAEDVIRMYRNEV